MKNTHVGFNLQWMYDPAGFRQARRPDLELLDFLANEGFSFLRIPLNYWFWVKDFDYEHPREECLALIQSYVEACVERGFHVSLNLHRAPGYCINGAELEKHNLWTEKEAQVAFTGMWTGFARRFADYTPENLSFDLLNEPPGIGQYGMDRENHKALMLATVQAIRRESPLRPITLDGLGGGNIAMPELANAGCVHSVRAYQPMSLTHYKASWCSEAKGVSLQGYPGCRYDGKSWNKETIRRHYDDWKVLSDSGVPVHVGEMGCYDKVPQRYALRWFRDVFDVLIELGWGFALWNFKGPFGVVGHKRPGTVFVKRGPYKVDAALWEMIKDARDRLA